MKSEIRVHRAPTIATRIRVPGDKSMSHRAAMLAALSDGRCVLRNYLPGEDCLGTVRVLGQLGVVFDQKHPGHDRSDFMTSSRGMLVPCVLRSSTAKGSPPRSSPSR